MRRLLAIVRRPLVWLPVAFVAWVWVFVLRAEPAPRFEIATGAVRRDEGIRPGGKWASLTHLSDDGTEVTVAAFKGDFRFANTRFQIWDAQAGVERTSGAWADPELARLAPAGIYGHPGVWAAIGHPGGREFLGDAEEMWMRSEGAEVAGSAHLRAPVGSGCRQAPG